MKVIQSVDLSLTIGTKRTKSSPRVLRIATGKEQQSVSSSVLKMSLSTNAVGLQAFTRSKVQPTKFSRAEITWVLPLKCASCSCDPMTNACCLFYEEAP